MNKRILSTLYLMSSLVILCCSGFHAEAQKPRALLLFGVYTDWYQFDKSLSNWEMKTLNAKTDGTDNLPSSEELSAYQLVILSDVGVASLGEGWIKKLKAYVESGGGLFILGGPFTLGLGGFEKTELPSFLPVDLKKFDLKWEKTGVAFSKESDHAVLANLDLSKSPLVYWIHQVTIRPGATVAIKAESYPLLILGAFGKGRIAIFTGTPLGRPQGDQVPFWKWDGWKTLVANTANYLSGR